MSMATVGAARRQSRTRSIHWKSVAESLCVRARVREKRSVCVTRVVSVRQCYVVCGGVSTLQMWIRGLASP